MVNCCVKGCKSRSERKEADITFHSFPHQSPIQESWVRATGRQNWEPCKTSRICSKHFEECCFRKTKAKTFLNSLSVPTLHIHEFQAPLPTTTSHETVQEPKCKDTSKITTSSKACDPLMTRSCSFMNIVETDKENNPEEVHDPLVTSSCSSMNIDEIDKENKPMAAPTIGIDLGTTYSCAAVYRKGRAEIIPNAEGYRITPSYVAFTDTAQLVGSAAKDQDALHPENTIFDAKRLIGRKYDDPLVQRDIPFWPFKIINDKGRPKIEVQYKRKKKTLFPEEVSSMVLAKMKESAEAYLGKKVQNAVITVPAYFSDSQRQATKDAGTIAGLNVLRIINEPTAAALAYGLDTESSIERNVLIYDLGGGTFDVSVLTIEEGIFEVRSTAGDTHLGGMDFDNNMVLHFIKEIKTKYNRDISNDFRAIRRLRKACEKAKRLLSSSTVANINLFSLFDGIGFHSDMTRTQFEKLNRNLFRSTLKPVEKALKDAAISKCDIADVVLVGGSTRIPMVQRLLKKFFDGKELKKTVNPEEAVALGAAIQAAVLDDEPINVLLVDVTSLSLGTAVRVDEMSVIIPRNTTIPARKTTTYHTSEENQTEIIFEIREGESPMASENNLLGEFTLGDLPPMPRGEVKVDVTFEIDTDGILQVNAMEQNNTSNCKSITTACHKGHQSRQEIKKLIDQAKSLKIQD